MRKEEEETLPREPDVSLLPNFEQRGDSQRRHGTFSGFQTRHVEQTNRDLERLQVATRREEELSLRVPNV